MRHATRRPKATIVSTDAQPMPERPPEFFRRHGANDPAKIVCMTVAISTSTVPDKVAAAQSAAIRELLTPEEIEAAAVGLDNILGGGWRG